MDFYLPGLTTQSRTVALRTERISPIAAQKNAHVQFVFLALQIFEESADTREPFFAVDDQALMLRIEFRPGDVERDIGLPREAFHPRGPRAAFPLRPPPNRPTTHTFPSSMYN